MQPKTLALNDPWAAAYAMATGVTLVKVVRGVSPSFVFDDSLGHASRALGEWRDSTGMIAAREYARTVRLVRRLARR